MVFGLLSLTPFLQRCSEIPCYFLCFSMFVYQTATLRIQTREQDPRIPRPLLPQSYRSIAVFGETQLLHAVLVWVVDSFFVLQPFQKPVHFIHLFHFIVFDLGVAKQTSILRHSSVRNRGREISDHIFRDFFGRTQKWLKSSKGNPRFTNVIPSRSIRRWCRQNNRFVSNFFHLEPSFDQYSCSRQTSHQQAFL